jgi:hypothetical protein
MQPAFDYTKIQGPPGFALEAHQGFGFQREGGSSSATITKEAREIYQNLGMGWKRHGG